MGVHSSGGERDVNRRSGDSIGKKLLILVTGTSLVAGAGIGGLVAAWPDPKPPIFTKWPPSDGDIVNCWQVSRHYMPEDPAAVMVGGGGRAVLEGPEIGTDERTAMLVAAVVKRECGDYLREHDESETTMFTIDIGAVPAPTSQNPNAHELVATVVPVDRADPSS